MPAGAASILIKATDQVLDTPMDYKSMAAIGSNLGSASVIVLDETVDMLWLAYKTVSFFCHESCGNCTPCRIGNRILSDTLERIRSGNGEMADLEVLRRTADTMAKTSLCSLGQSASNPITSSLRQFLSEYESQLSLDPVSIPEFSGETLL